MQPSPQPIFKPFHPPPKFLCACLQSGPAPALPTWCALHLYSFALLEIAYTCSVHCLFIHPLMGIGIVSRFGLLWIALLLAYSWPGALGCTWVSVIWPRWRGLHHWSLSCLRKWVSSSFPPPDAGSRGLRSYSWTPVNFFCLQISKSLEIWMWA